jgi:hypothetical protein
MVGVKRLRRIAWNMLAAISALLCLSISCLSIMDNSQRPFVLVRGGRGIDVFVGGGITFGNAPPVSDTWIIIDRHESFAGFQYVHFSPQFGPHPKSIWLALVPYWFVLGSLAALPLAWIASFARRRRRIAANLCAECGYDLRASPSRCPECGTVPAKR